MSNNMKKERNTSVTTVRVDKELKEKTNEIFKNMGVSFSTAVTMFLVQCVKENGLPFDANGDSISKEN